MNFTNFSGGKALSGTQTPPTKTPNIGTQNWNGMQIPGDVATKNLVSYDAKTGNRTFKLPDFVGGGVYTENAQRQLVNTPRNDDGLGLGGAQPGMERDHIIPVSNGGASVPGNGQMIPSSIANPQDAVEKNAAQQIKSGVPPKAVMTDTLRQKQQIQNKPDFLTQASSFFDNILGVGAKTLSAPFDALGAGFADASKAVQVPGGLVQGKSVSQSYNDAKTIGQNVEDLLTPFVQKAQNKLIQNHGQGMGTALAASLPQTVGDAIDKLLVPTLLGGAVLKGTGASVPDSTFKDAYSNAKDTLLGDKGVPGNTPNTINPAIKPSINTPEMRNAQLKLQAAQDAHAQALKDYSDAHNQVDQLNQKAIEAQTNVSAKQQALNENIKARESGASPAVKAIDTINERVSSNKSQLGQDFQNGAQKLDNTDPNTKLNLTNKQLEALNALKESRNFTLPDKLNSESGNVQVGGRPIDSMGPAQRAAVEKELGIQGGQTAKSLSRVETQDLIKQLNRSTFKQNPDGSLAADQQRIGITNEIKDVASKAFGPEWDKVYSQYSTGRSAIEKIDNLTNLDPKATPDELNKQLQGIQKLSSTPEGKIRLQQSIDEYKQSTAAQGHEIDLNDPVKAIQQVMDRDMAIEESKGNLSDAQKQSMEALKAKIAGAKNIDDAQKVLEKAQRDAEIQKNNLEQTTKEQIKQQKYENSFRGKHPQAVKWADYAARIALIGSALRLLVYPQLSKLTKAPAKPTKPKTSKYGGLN